ncbi:MAG: hypothetical protein WC875_04450, partial [Candidatus Absconditabacterales bacterium]
PNIKDKADKKYNFALLPYGPHFYTGILQSAGYLLLPEKKNLLFLLPQDIQDDEIFQIDGTIGPLFGKQRTLPKHPKSWKTISKIPQNIIEIIVQHLLFLDIITQTKYITCLAVGKDLSGSNQKKLAEYIHAHTTTTNIVFLTNVPADEGKKKAESIEKKQGLLSLFHHIAKGNKKEVEVIAYSNAGNLGRNKGKGIKYACMLA